MSRRVPTDSEKRLAASVAAPAVDWRARARAAEARAAELERDLAEARDSAAKWGRNAARAEMRATREAAGRDALGAFLGDVLHNWPCLCYLLAPDDKCGKCRGLALMDALAEDRKGGTDG